MSGSEKIDCPQAECLDPEMGARVYDYYNGALEAADVREFEQHLIRCPHCESVILQLDQIMMMLQDEQGLDSENGEAKRSSLNLAEQRRA